MEGPSTKITFLGITICSVSMTLTIDDQNLADFKTLLQGFAMKKHASRTQLESLAGKMSWISQVCHGGRIYLMRVFAMICSLQQTNINTNCRMDFIRIYNGGFNVWILFMASL